MKIVYYVSLIIYYLIGNKIPNKFWGVEFRRILVRNIFKQCGKNIHIAENVYFGMGQNIILGDYAGIGKGTKIYGNGVVEIGSNNIMGPDVMIITGDHSISINYEENLIVNKNVTKGVYIGEQSYIGARTTILKGVRIGKQSIVGACSLVNKDVEERTLYAGVPATKIRNL